MFLNAENLKEDMLFCGPAYKFFFVIFFNGCHINI